MCHINETFPKLVLLKGKIDTGVRKCDNLTNMLSVLKDCEIYAIKCEAANCSNLREVCYNTNKTLVKVISRDSVEPHDR